MNIKISAAFFLVSVFALGSQAAPHYGSNNGETGAGLVKRSSMNKMGCLGMTCFSGGGGSDDEGQNQSRRHLNQSHREHYREALSDDESEPRRSYHRDSEADLAASPEAQGAISPHQGDSETETNHDAQELYELDLAKALSASMHDLNLGRGSSFGRKRGSYGSHSNSPYSQSPEYDPNFVPELNYRVPTSYQFPPLHQQPGSTGEPRMSYYEEEGTSLAPDSTSRQRRSRSRRSNSQRNQDSQGSPQVQQQHHQGESTRRSRPRIPKPS